MRPDIIDNIMADRVVQTAADGNTKRSPVIIYSDGCSFSKQRQFFCFVINNISWIQNANEIY